MAQKLRWYLRQLLPLTYRSHYGIVDGDDIKPAFAVWKMWFGRCFAIDEVIVARIVR